MRWLAGSLQGRRIALPGTDDLINQNVGRVLDLFGIDNSIVKRWAGAQPKRK